MTTPEDKHQPDAASGGPGAKSGAPDAVPDAVPGGETVFPAPARSAGSDWVGEPTVADLPPFASQAEAAPADAPAAPASPEPADAPGAGEAGRPKQPTIGETEQADGAGRADDAAEAGDTARADDAKTLTVAAPVTKGSAKQATKDRKNRVNRAAKREQRAARPGEGAAINAAKNAGKRSDRRSRLRTAGRAIAAAAVVALGVGAVLGAAYLPPAAEVAPPALTVDVPPSQTSVVCPAPVQAASGGGSDADLGGASEVATTLLAGALARDGDLGATTWGTLAGEAAEVSAGPLAALTEVGEPGLGVTVVRGAPTDASSAFVVGGIAQRAESGDLRGLAALACGPGRTTSWFTAGRTTVGSSALLTLANGGSTPATVTLRVWGEGGSVPVERGEIVIAPGASVLQPMEAVAPDLERLTFAVSSRGGVVSASLATQDLAGLTPAGFDLVGPTGPPATRVLVPGVELGTSTVDDPDPSLVRVLNPEDAPVEVVLELLGPDGPIPLGGDTGFIVDPGAVTDVSLAGAPPGTYTVRASADTPVVVGASVVRVGSPDPADPDTALTDRAWVSSVPAATGSAVILPGLGTLADRATLVLATGGEGDVPVTLVAMGLDGEELERREVSVAANRSSAVDVLGLSTGARLLAVNAPEGVSAGVLLGYGEELGDLVTVIPATEDPQVERSVAVAVTLD